MHDALPSSANKPTHCNGWEIARRDFLRQAGGGCGALALVLTGMGTDGADGAGDIAAAGGSVIAQDEATSVVWGMPGSAAQAGACSAVLPLDEIAPKLVRIFAGDRT